MLLLAVVKFLLLIGLTRETQGFEVELSHHTSTSLLHVKVRTDSIDDLKRIARTSRYQALTGRSQAEIATKFNLYASEHASVSSVVPCSDLTSSEIASLAHKLKPLTDDEIKLSLPETDGRQVYADPVVASFFDSPGLHDLQCVETMKLWAHHIPKSVKNDPSTSVVLPTVPHIDEIQLIAGLLHDNRTLSCVAGHTVVNLENEEGDEQSLGELDWPHWPAHFHFRGLGMGPYPFWQFGPKYENPTANYPINQTLTDLYGGNNDLEVWHDTSKRATKFYHGACMWSYVGHEELGKTPCMALQFGIFHSKNFTNEHAGKWFLFTANSSTRSSNGQFCCDATFNHKPTGEALGTINRKFVDNMKYVGEKDFHGNYYDGVAKQYVMAMDDAASFENEPKLPLVVWYETDMQGKPLRFAEIGSASTFVEDLKLMTSDYPYIYEELDPSSFDTEVFSDAVFHIPDVCKGDDLPVCGPPPPPLGE